MCLLLFELLLEELELESFLVAVFFSSCLSMLSLSLLIGGRGSGTPTLISGMALGVGWIVVVVIVLSEAPSI